MDHFLFGDQDDEWAAIRDLMGVREGVAANLRCRASLHRVHRREVVDLGDAMERRGPLGAEVA